MGRALALAACLAGLGTFLSWAPRVEAKDDRVFALVVTSNRSLSFSQPDLAYADDDGARYFALLRESAERSADAVLLTSFDAATRAAYPELASVAAPPTRNELTRAVERISAAVRESNASGSSTTFYFVYAGHGEMRDGRGYLALEDGVIDGNYIEREVLARVSATTKHVVLDSCNSFFVINPRKPGGRRWATPEDMALGFSARNPEVGLFLSTNAEAEVYEWSQLESGVFSHEVRSGLRGAADVDGDGRVTYVELAGFVEQANLGIVREALRPHVYFRGPHGHERAPILALTRLRGRRVTMKTAPVRAWVLDARGERVLDLHKERAPLTLVLPADQGELTLYEAQAGDASRSATVTAHSLGSESRPALGQTEAHAPEASVRGQSVFGELFNRPYGPTAYDAYVRGRATAPPPVYGLSETDLRRSQHYLAGIADASRAFRRRRTFSLLGLAALAAAATVVQAVDLKGDAWIVPAVASGAVSLTLGVAGLYTAFALSPGERAQRALERDLSDAKLQGGQAFVRTEALLDEVERKMRRHRRVQFALMVTAAVLLALDATFAVLDGSGGGAEISPPIEYAQAALFLGAGLAKRIMPTGIERMIKLYRTDPEIRLQLSMQPAATELRVGLSGRF